jgi:hypothetical protein
MVAAIVRALPATAPGDAASTADAGPPAQHGDAPEPPVFDRACYDVMATELGDDAVQELVGIFIAETERRLARLQKLTNDLDRGLIGREAHSLKSDAAALGLMRVSRLAAAIEQDAARMSDAELRALVARIAPAFAEGRERLPRPVASAA